jgi:alcohol dehydrogenase (cytochrome c)
MRSVWLSIVFGSSLVWAVAPQQQPQEPAPTSQPQAAAPARATPAWLAKCSSCHGPAMTGAKGPSILTYVRYHTNADIIAVMRTRTPPHPAVKLTDAELETVMADMRVLAGTNPAIATAGFTGGPRGRSAGGVQGALPSASARGGNAGPGAGRAGQPPDPAAAANPAAAAGAPAFGGRGGRGGRGAAPIALADGKKISGSFVSLSETDATVLADGKFYLLTREGNTYSEKPSAPKADWDTYAGSNSGNRYSALDQINTTTVQKLGVAWIAPLGQSRGESSPVVVDGVMYVTGWNEISALDATTGRQLWSYGEPHTLGLLGDAAGGANRGAAISGDRVFMTTDNAHLMAFNRFTGQKLWDVEMGNYKEGYTTTGAPLIVGDLVIHGISGGDEGIRGFLDAYKISSGERAWRFYTIPKRGEKGSETWKGHAIDHGCGATWLTGSYDAELDLVYWGVGNPCPDYAGQERLGDNLYTSSVIALSAKSGELKWHYQFSPHDTHDWDAAQPMLLVDEVWQGQPRKLLMNGNRNGMFYVLDRVNGEFLLADKLSTKVTWNSGFTKEGKPIIDPASVSSYEGSPVCPAGTGGTNWQSASYNPVTKLFYARVSDSCGIFTAQKDDPLRTDNRWMGGTARGTLNPAVQAVFDKLMEGYQSGTFIRAMDPFTGKKVWDYAGGAGVMSTAGGLVFFAGGGGMTALDAKTGKMVWQHNAGQSSSSAPVTYMYGGKQYITLAGTTGVVTYTVR